MNIPLVTGVGVGSTLLSAFDDALRACGALNYNLIPLSSVIPPASTVVPLPRYTSDPDEHGHRLYVVKAEVRSDDAGKRIGAGIGWYQWGDGHGACASNTRSRSCTSSAPRIERYSRVSDN